MMTDVLGQIESEIRAINGVVGVLFLDERAGLPTELQVFTGDGALEREIRQSIAEILGRFGMLQSVERIFLFNFKRESLRGGRGRPLIGDISVSTSGPTVEAHVSLLLDGRESEGRGSGPRTAHSLRVVAATTLEAAMAFLGRSGLFALEGVSMVEVLGQKVVIVLVNSVFGEKRLVLGASMVGDGEIHEAAVKAALDAVNRQIAFILR